VAVLAPQHEIVLQSLAMRPALVHLASFAAYLPASSLPAVAAQVGAGVGASGDPSLLVVPFCAAFAVAFPVWGAVADRCDRRLVMAAALVLLALAGAVVAGAASEAGIVVGRALQGLAAAGVPPAAQALLAARASAADTGRAVGGMMVAVALATLGGPLLATAALPLVGWRGAALAVGVLVAAVAAVALLVARGEASPAASAPGAARGARGAAPSSVQAPPAARGARGAAPSSVQAPPAARQALRAPSSVHAPSAAGVPRVALRPTRGLVAGWLVSALVLGGYWTALTRLGTILAPSGLDAPAWLAAAAALAGAAGIPLVLLAARAADRRGPRAPMLATTFAGAAALAAAAAAPDATAFVLAAGVALALYWAYLPVVAVQVQRSAGAALRGRAAGVLYASMWLGAAVAGTGAAALPGWRAVLASAAALWALAALVTWRGFLAGPAPAAPAPAEPRPAARAA
jgi:MFS family permease